MPAKVSLVIGYYPTDIGYYPIQDNTHRVSLNTIFPLSKPFLPLPRPAQVKHNSLLHLQSYVAERKVKVENFKP